MEIVGNVSFRLAGFTPNSIILEGDLRYNDVINDVNTHNFLNCYCQQVLARLGVVIVV